MAFIPDPIKVHVNVNLAANINIHKISDEKEAYEVTPNDKVSLKNVTKIFNFENLTPNALNYATLFYTML